MNAGNTARRHLAARVYDAAHITGTFTLRSGVVSNEYFDKYMFESDPRLLREVAAACASLVPSDVDGLAGLELGGVPLATMLSQILDMPTMVPVSSRIGDTETASSIRMPSLRTRGAS